MCFLTLEQTRRNIVELGVPQIVLDAFDRKRLPYNLDIQFGFPSQVFYHGPMGYGFYSQHPVTPIWVGDHSVAAYHHDPVRQGYFRFDFEGGEEEAPVAMNWQQLLVKEFKFLWEAVTPDDRLRELANLFGFKYVELLISELSEAKLDTSERDTVWYESFLKRVEG